MKQRFFTAGLLTIFSVLSYLFYQWSPSTIGERVFASLLSLLILYVLFRIFIEEIVARRITDAKTRYSFRKAVFLFLIIFVLIIWLRIWVPNPQTLLVAYGVVAAGLAVALQDVVKNLAGSIMIFMSGMFQVGNRIEINGTQGDVIDIGIFNTTLLEIRGWMTADQATGRITTIPNGVVLSKPVQNFTRHHEFLWDEISIVVTGESDWGEAMRIMGEIAEEHTADYMDEANRSLTRLERYYYVEGRVLDPDVYIEPSTNGYSLILRYVVSARKRRSTNSNIWGHILRVFDEHDKIFVAPTTIANTEYPKPKSDH